MAPQRPKGAGALDTKPGLSPAPVKHRPNLESIADVIRRRLEEAAAAQPGPRHCGGQALL